VTISEARERFIDHLEEIGRAPATIVAYNKDLEQLDEFLAQRGKTQVDEVELADLKAFQEVLLSRGYTPKSVSRKTNSIRTLFKHLKSTAVLPDDPASLLTHPKYQAKPLRILSPTEYRALRDAARNDVRTSAIIEILLQSGIRISELAALTIDDIKFGAADKPGELFIRGSNRYTQRRIPLNRVAQEAIKAWQKVRPAARIRNLFVTKTGRPLLVRNIRSQIDRYYKLAGVGDAKVNDLRHTFIAHQLRSGAPLHLVSKLAGHKRTTEKYLEYLQDRNESKLKLEEL
jgi:site-specific recombinase XerD